MTPHHHGLPWSVMMILGVMVGLAIVGFFVVFFYLPSRPRKMGLQGRLRKRGRQVRFVRQREAWMDKVALSGLDAHDRRSLAKHLSSAYPELRRKAARILREKGGAEGIGDTQRQLCQRGDPDLVAEAIISAQWSEMEPALLPSIEGKERVARAAMSALAEVGGRDSLSKLLAQNGRPDLAEARGRAIVRLQARLGGQSSGQVSLANGDQGGTLGFPKE